MFFFHVYVSDYLGLALKTRFLFEIFCRPIWVCFFSIYYFRRQSIRNCPTSVSPPADAYVSNMPIYREIHLAKLKKGNLSIHFHIVLILNLSCTAYWQLRKFCFRRQLAKLRHVFLFHRQHKYYKTYLKLWNSFSTSFIWNNIFDGESYGVFGYCSFSFWKSFIIFLSLGFKLVANACRGKTRDSYREFTLMSFTLCRECSAQDFLIFK